MNIFRSSQGLDHFVDYRAQLVYLALHHISSLKEKKNQTPHYLLKYCVGEHRPDSVPEYVDYMQPVSLLISIK